MKRMKYGYPIWEIYNQRRVLNIIVYRIKGAYFMVMLLRKVNLESLAVAQQWQTIFCEKETSIFI